MDKIALLLDQLETKLKAAKRLPRGILPIVEQMRAALGDVAQAKEKLARERERLTAQAREEAERIVAQAHEQAVPVTGEEAARTIRPLPALHEMAGMLKTIYFDYDKSAIRSDQRIGLDQSAEVLLGNPEINVLLEGHCDERGTVEYNFALGGRRATSIREYLIKKGIAEHRLATLSKGEEEPANVGHNEEAWAKNRRVEFIIIE